MDLNVTPIMSEDCSLMSASRFELGENAGQITWANCLAFAESQPLLATDATRDEIREHFASYGAWETDEIESWSDIELSAMIWQEAAASMREFEDYCDGDLATYEAACEACTISCRLHLTETTATFYVGC